MEEKKELWNLEVVKWALTPPSSWRWGGKEAGGEKDEPNWY